MKHDGNCLNSILKSLRNLCKIGRYNVSGSGTISLQELKIMMEKLGAPQTHLGLKAMIKEVIMRNNEKLTS